MYETRQRLRLSFRAYETVESDRYSMAVSDELKYSGFINRIIESFTDTFIKHHQAQDKELIRQYLKKEPAKGRTSKKEQPIPYFRKNVIAKLKANELEIKKDLYDGDERNFIRAVIETYARKPFDERERIYFKDIVNKIEHNLGLGRLLKVTISDGRVFFVKPYAIMTDKYSLNNYLVCYSARQELSLKYTPASFRLSRIRDIEVADVKKNALLTESEINHLKKAISDRSVQYLLGTTEKIVVKFTEMGKIMFHHMVFQRPQPEKSEGLVYEFSCTLKQAEAYFFKFGADAKILEPIDLKISFQKKYQKAACLYDDNLAPNTPEIAQN